MLIQVQYEAVMVGAAATIDVRAERVRLLPSTLSGKGWAVGVAERGARRQNCPLLLPYTRRSWKRLSQARREVICTILRDQALSFILALQYTPHGPQPGPT